MEIRVWIIFFHSCYTRLIELAPLIHSTEVFTLYNCLPKHRCVCCAPVVPEEARQICPIPGTGVVGSYEPLCGYWILCKSKNPYLLSYVSSL